MKMVECVGWFRLCCLQFFFNLFWRKDIPFEHWRGVGME